MDTRLHPGFRRKHETGNPIGICCVFALRGASGTTTVRVFAQPAKRPTRYLGDSKTRNVSKHSRFFRNVGTAHATDRHVAGNRTSTPSG